ncbi:hypothetical protein [Salana multivorans]|uniref:hypothetical protein n=1 Tax=Salana multivorans TaxID=120377 RepID=UPI0011CD4A6A|nr:hypothetical protein [Salana multivorans]
MRPEPLGRLLGGLVGLAIGYALWSVLLGAVRAEVPRAVIDSSEALATALAVAAVAIVLGCGVALALVGVLLARALSRRTRRAMSSAGGVDGRPDVESLDPSV